MKKALDSNLDFNGQAGTGVNGHGTNGRFAGNQHGGKPGGNYGRGPTRAGTTGDSVPNVTARSGKINGGAEAKCPPNSDKINVGSGPRKGNA